MTSEEEEDSIWLFDVLESIGVNDEFRKAWQQIGITCEILETFKSLITSNNYGSSREATVTQSLNNDSKKTSQKEYIICNFPDIFQNIRTSYLMGSTFEATVTPGEPHDLDFMECQEWLSVIEDIAKAEKNKFSLLIVREPETPAGYVKLQLVGKNKPLISLDWPYVQHLFPNIHHCFKTDTLNRLVLCDFFMIHVGGHMLSRLENTPALKQEKYYGVYYDAVISYRGKTWPSMANEWLIRSRLYGWPTKDMIQDLKSLGFFVVRKGHPFSSEIDLEWRISLTLQERKLVNNLTNVQHKCYVFLKLINRDILNLECITSYHWKTCLFYMIEGNKEEIWEKRLLFHCVKLCIKQMLKWVKNGVCPNYFIPAENLFDGRLTDSLKTTSEEKLVELLKIGFSCLLSIKSNNICDCFKSRSFNRSDRFQEKYKEAFITALNFDKTKILRIAHSVFDESILSYYFEQTNDVHCKFINFLWLSKDSIQNIRTIFEHTAHEVKLAQALLLPCINTCLASTLSAFAFNMTQFDTRDILLLGSLSYLFINGTLSGRLKLISILLAAELFADCEYQLGLMEKDIKCSISFCVCRHCPTDSYFLPRKYFNTSTVSTCLSFLPIELPIIPDAMKYEMFRFVGTSIHKIDNTNIVDQWNFKAVVDCNIYFFLLKYLLKKKLRKVKECNKAKNDIMNLLRGDNVIHLDVAFNLLASICFSEFNTPDALTYLACSWKIMTSSDLCYGIFTEEMKRKQYQYNAAKIHAMVILYKTWFARIPSDVHFCFQCFCKSETRLQQCSRCKVSTYCDKHCQRKNWKIHKKTCKMARKHHILFSTSVIPFAFHK